MGLGGRQRLQSVGEEDSGLGRILFRLLSSGKGVRVEFCWNEALGAVEWRPQRVFGCRLLGERTDFSSLNSCIFSTERGIDCLGCLVTSQLIGWVRS